MYFWSAKALAKDFAEGKVSRLQRCLYLVGWILVLAYSDLDKIALRMPAHQLSVFDTFLKSVCVVLGVLWCYRANQSADGEEFIDRLVAFGFTNFARVQLLAAAFVWSLVVIGGAFFWAFHTNPFPSSNSSSNYIADALLEVPFYALFFYLVASNMKLVGTSKEGILGQSKVGDATSNLRLWKREGFWLIVFCQIEWIIGLVAYRRWGCSSVPGFSYLCGSYSQATLSISFVLFFIVMPTWLVNPKAFSVRLKSIFHFG
jgi:hypothetical protein